MRGIFPLFLNGKELTSETPKVIRRLLQSAFEDQYENETFEEYNQLEKCQRMIIVDNFGSAPLTQSKLQKILKGLSARADYVLAVGHSDLRIQQFVRNDEGNVQFSEFTHAELIPMNRSERMELIRNWVFLARENRSDDALLEEFNQRQQSIETALDTGIVQPFPSLLLAALQFGDALTVDIDQKKYGTFGYLYQTLINSRFASLEDADEIDLGQTFLLLAKMAMAAFKKEQGLSISFEEIHEILVQYRNTYGSEVYEPRFLSQIVAAGVMKKIDGCLEFANSQIRDYFVAHNLSTCLHDESEEIRREAMVQIDFIVKTISFEAHTRILLFLVFLASDRVQFIRHVLNAARLILAEFTPADFDDDVQFLNELETDRNEVLKLKDGNIWDRLADEDRRIDEASSDAAVPSYANPDSFLVEYRPDLDMFVKAAIALKMVEVLGQLVRSFSTTLQAPLKRELVQECADLGLRLLQALYKLRGEDIVGLRQILGCLIKEKHNELTDAELIQRADDMLLNIFRGVTFGVLRKISVSAGLPDLKTIYADIFNKPDLPLSYKMIDAALRLDHYKDPRIEKILEFVVGLENTNKFMWEVMRLLFLNYFNFTAAARIKNRDSILSKLQLQDGPQLLLNTEKRERKYLPAQSGGEFQPPHDESK